MAHSCSTCIISLILFIFLVNGDKFVNDELDGIDKYELVYIETNTSSSSKMIQFIAFDQMYSIELIENPYIIPSAIKHSNGNPSIEHDLEQYFTHLNETCHYFGVVLNSAQASAVALSMCSKRGIRGSITAFGDTLIIKPSKYYLDIEYDRHHYHDITDEHLIYKLQRTKTSTQKRRLLTDVINNVEMYILSDPILTAYYVSKYPSNWYDQLASYLADEIHSVSREYQNTDWGSTVGTIAVSLVELEVLHDYNGKYKALTPIPYNAECTDVQQWDTHCTIDGSVYLDDFTDYLVNYKNVSTFDNAQLWSKMGFEGRDGLAWPSTVCQGAGSSSIVSMRQVGDVGVIKVSAHELGHNFGMNDDEEPKCDIYQGIMGQRPNGFSTCSVQSLQNYFETYRRRITCLSDGIHPFTSNYGEAPLETSAPTTKPIYSGSSADWQCVTIQNMDDNAFNGDWIWDGSSGTYKTYVADAQSYYLYHLNGVISYWVISDVKGSEAWSESIFAYCKQDVLVDCSGSWIKYIKDSGWYRDTTAHVSECDSNYVIPTSSPTQPTAEPTAPPKIESECVLAKDMEMDIGFNGYWSMIGSNMEQKMYRLDDYYLYFVSSYEWVISKVEGSQSIHDILAYCRTSEGTAVKDCEGPWRILNTKLSTYDKDLDGVFTDCDEWKCVGLLHMDNSILDGYWTLYSDNPVYDGRTVYTLHGLYLYYVSIWTQWVISAAFGSTDMSTLWAYCKHAAIEECANSWSILDEYFVNDTHSTVYDCGEGNDDPCSYYDCITVSMMEIDFYDNNYNGEWYPSGCYNGEAYYMSEGYGDTRYMCYNNDKWLITDVLCDDQMYAYCFGDDILDCNDAWYIYDGNQHIEDKTVMMWQCSAKPPINDDTDTEYYSCYNLWNYDDILCIYSNGTMWNGFRVFLMVEGKCANDKPVFHHKVYDVNDLIAGIESYYLHFNKYIDEDGEWIISMNDISTKAEALCAESDLLDCTKGVWVKNVAESDVVGNEAAEVTIYEGWCDSGDDSIEPGVDEDNKTKKKSGGVNTFVIMAILMSAILLVIIAMAIWLNRKKKTAIKSSRVEDSRGHTIFVGKSTMYKGEELPDYSDDDEQKLDISTNQIE